MTGFDTSRTCGSCAFIGTIYWNDQTHHCRKTDERRCDNFRSCGDFAEDFMSEFRKFYDAKADQRACRHYKEREPLNRETLDLLRAVEAAGDAGFVAKFFSRENSLLSRWQDKFVESDFAYPKEPARGERRYRLTKLGRVEIARDRDGSGEAGQTRSEAEGLDRRQQPGPKASPTPNNNPSSEQDHV